jgi:hypothetical protein
MLAQASKCAVCGESFLNTWLECVRFIYYSGYIQTHHQKNKKIKRADQILPEVYGTTLSNKRNSFYFWGN